MDISRFEQADFDRLSQIIESRRSTLRMDDRPIPESDVNRLCELATWAPCHKLTWPWRFAVFTGDGRARLGDAFVTDMLAAQVGDDAKRAKTSTKYLRAPTVLVVGCAANDHPTFHDENRDAVAAAIQNILLGATTLGIATLWSTPPVIDGPTVLDLCGFAGDDRIIGVIYMGYANAVVTPPERPAPVNIRHVI